MLNPISIRDLLVESEWTFRESANPSAGVEHLVHLCHDIMRKTKELVQAKHCEQRAPLHSCELWSSMRLNTYKSLTDADRAVLNRAQMLDLMTIVFEAATTSASISNLVRIWREASQHVTKREQELLPVAVYQPRISYENAFRHLIHSPDNALLQVALHAALLTSHSRMDLQDLGERLGVKKTQFDMGSIRDSTHNFQDLIKFLREQKTQEREQQTVDTNKLPYKPRKKRGLNANVSGTKFPAGSCRSLQLQLSMPTFSASRIGRVRLCDLRGDGLHEQHDLERHVDLHGDRLCTEALPEDQPFPYDE